MSEVELGEAVSVAGAFADFRNTKTTELECSTREKYNI